MDIEHFKLNFHFEKLTKNHDLSEFCCDDEDLNDFLKNDALGQQSENLNATQLIIYNNKIIGFVSLLADKLKLKLLYNNTKKDIKKQSSEIKEIPAVKIGRLAIIKRLF